MFLATSLKEKMKRNYSDIDNETLCQPKFPYQQSPKDPRVLISFRAEDNEGIKLQVLENKEWENKFTIKKLHQKWLEKMNLNFQSKHKKFSDDTMRSSIVEAKKMIKESLDPDILEVKQKNWNQSTNPLEKIRPELKHTLFEVNNGLNEFNVVSLKEQLYQEGCDTRNKIILDGKKWNITSKVEEKEIKDVLFQSKEKATENSLRYWKNNEFSRYKQDPLPISEERKKIELIRYFKRYRVPSQFTSDYNINMKKVKVLTALERSEVEKDIRYINPGIKCQEKVDALVEKAMYNSYKYKYNEITGKLDKEEIKRRQREKNKFRWKDEDLIRKILAVNNIDNTVWVKPRFSRLFNSQDILKRELLKPLVIKGNEIYLEEDKIIERLEYEYKKQQKKELLLKQRKFKKIARDKTDESKYPIDEDVYNELVNDSNEMNMNNHLHKNYSCNDLLGSKSHFKEAYQKIVEKEIEKVYKSSNQKGNESLDFFYKHPGTYVIITFITIDRENLNLKKIFKSLLKEMKKSGKSLK